MEHDQILKEERKLIFNPYIAVASIILILYFAVPLIADICPQPFLNAVSQFQDVMLHVAMLAIPILYIFYKRKNLKQTFESLGLSRDGLNLKNIGIGIFVYVMLFAFIFFCVLIYAIILFASGVKPGSELTNAAVVDVFLSAPLWFKIFAFTIVPITEETFSRGFLTPRLGIFWSSAIFAALHLGYCSIPEVAFAFVFGLVIAYTFKRTKSLYPGITAHAIWNFVSIVAASYLG